MNHDISTGKQVRNENGRQASREAVAQRAYQLWEAAGRPVGRDLEYWLRAEAELGAAARRRAPGGDGQAETAGVLAPAGQATKPGKAENLDVPSALRWDSDKARGTRPAGRKSR